MFLPQINKIKQILLQMLKMATKHQTESININNYEEIFSLMIYPGWDGES
jgi:hypothetical protein